MNHDQRELVLPRFRDLHPPKTSQESDIDMSYHEAKQFWQKASGDYTMKANQYCNGDSFAIAPKVLRTETWNKMN